MHKQPIKSPPKSLVMSGIGGGNQPPPIQERKIKNSSNQKKSCLPTYKTPSVLERDRLKERERKDSQLLIECISMGISRSIRNDVSSTVAAANLNSKNGETTSVVVSDLRSAPSTATGVEKESQDGTNEYGENQFSPDTILMKPNGYSPSGQDFHNSLINTSNSSINLFLNSSDNILERSNEYPALQTSNLNFTADSSLQNSISEINRSNEYLYENSEMGNGFSSKIDKHKDPDLMLKSVERLTHELVTTAEYLRTNNSTIEEKKSSSTNNTWNEDTCPNDVSFPSISMTAPMIASMNEDDTTMSDNHPTKGWVLEDETPTNDVPNFAKATEMCMMKEKLNEVLCDASMDKTLSFDMVKDSIDGYESLEPESKTLTTEYQGKILNAFDVAIN